MAVSYKCTSDNTDSFSTLFWFGCQNTQTCL